MTTTVETAVGTAKTMVLNMGPQHPSTHGVLRVLLELDGENVVTAIPDLGYLHTGIEKSCEDKTYSQAITLTDRMDYLNPLGNNLVYCLAVEKLLGLEVPKRAQYIRVMMVVAATDFVTPGLAGNTCAGYGRHVRDVVLLPANAKRS